MGDEWVQKGASIRQYHADYLEENAINFSKWVRQKLDEDIDAEKGDA